HIGRGRRILGGSGGQGTRSNGRGSRLGLAKSGTQRCEEQRHEAKKPKHALYVIGSLSVVKIIAGRGWRGDRFKF
ncbi:MAG: hypothetical protein QOF24_874, partial [Verrucomicrobiota bacterium]